MISVEGELVPLKTRIKPNDANGAVEKWLVQVRAAWLGLGLGLTLGPSMVHTLSRREPLAAHAASALAISVRVWREGLIMTC